MEQIVFMMIPLMGMSFFIHLFYRRCTKNVVRLVVWIIFAVYALGNLYFTLLSRAPGSGHYLELQPFRVYSKLFETQPEEVEATGFVSKYLFGTPPIVGLILNIILYFPLGYLLSILFPRFRFFQVILIGCLCSIATEVVQYIFKMGWCETDDVIHNTLGTVIGTLVWYLQAKRLNYTNE